MFRLCALVALVAAPCAAQNMDWTNIFVADCNAGVHIFPNTPAELNMNGDMVKMVLDSMEGVIMTAAKKACPSISNDDFHNWMVPNLQWALKNSLPRDKEQEMRDAFAAKCPKLASGGLDFLVGIRKQETTDTTINEETASQIRSILPTTCTYDRYAEGTGCGMAFKLPSLDIEIRGVATKCPNSAIMPFGKIQCRGGGCADIGKPCDVDADCGGAGNSAVVCTPMLESGKLSNQEMFEGMADTDLFLKKADKSHWSMTQNDFCGKVFPGGEGALGMITDAKSWMKKTFYFDDTAAQAKGTEMKVCYLKGAFTGPQETKLFERFEKKDAVTAGIFDNIGTDMESQMKENGGSLLAPFANRKIGNGQLYGQGFSTPLIANKNADTPTLFYENCLGEGGFSLFNPRLGGAMSMPAQGVFFARLIKYLRDTQDCRADFYKAHVYPNVERLTDNQFRMSWSVWHANRWLHQLDLGAKGGDSDSLTSDKMWGLLDYLFSDEASNLPPKRRRLLGASAGAKSSSTAFSALKEFGNKLSAHPIARQLMDEITFEEQMADVSKISKLTNWIGIGMPKSCTYKTYRDFGQCRVSYDAIGAMIDMDTGLKFSVSRCSGEDVREGQPAGAFGISGPFTKAIQKPTACSGNGDCGKNMVCQDFWNLKNLEGKALMDDDMEESMTKGYRESIGHYVFGKDSAHSAGMTTADMKKDIRSIMKALAFEDRDDSSDLKFCIPDWEAAKNSFEGKMGGWPSKKTDPSLDWVVSNVAPKINNNDVEKVIEWFSSDKPEDYIPGPDTRIYWSIKVPHLNKDPPMRFPQEELPGGVIVKAKFKKWPISSCLKFDFKERRAFQATVAKIASNEKFTVDPVSVRVKCVDATATSRRLAESATVTLESEIRSIPDEQAGNVERGVKDISKDPQTFVAELSASKAAYAPDPVDCTSVVPDYSEYTECADVLQNAIQTDGCPKASTEHPVDLKCICAANCAPGSCDAVPRADTSERNALELKITKACVEQHEDNAAVIASFQQTTPTADNLEVTDVQVESNGVVDVSSDSDSGLGAGALAGIVIGALIAVALVAAIGVAVGKKMGRREAAHPVQKAPSVKKMETTKNPLEGKAAQDDGEYADEM